MDHQRFDALARLVATSTSRRTLLRGALASAIGLGLGRRQELRIVVPVAANGLACSSTNSPDIACEEISAYAAECGVVCPDPNGTVLKNHGGCTWVPPVQPKGGRYRITARLKRERGQPDQYCAKTTVTIDWEPQGEPRIALIDLEPPQDACCQDACDAEYARGLGELAQHENGHVAHWSSAVAEANAAWNRRTIEVCAATRDGAEAAWQAEFNRLTQETGQSIVDAGAWEPPQAGAIKCDVCAPGGPNKHCCKGACVECPAGKEPNPETCACDCPPASVAAVSAAGVELCCPENQAACDDGCCDGECTGNGNCCPSWGEVCGDACCGDGEQCCDGQCLENGSCCEEDRVACAGGCCQPGELCCNNECTIPTCNGQCCSGVCCEGVCCGDDGKCCNGSCIPETEECCANRQECGPDGGRCCDGDLCCHYSNPNGEGFCCYDPSFQYCSTSTGCGFQ
jgi:hypothetical protein